ncbi:hypothetical protein [Synoicihabitans lomoniglobus]|uniref:Uncharacterized protein n=1 Tax=Synoicihabitans lomoniglobus TaxID=2909285 RepID=A0AAE9ZXV6_9BACT|nr:hypothetical protein [Opitutaceae bacterium LMO-M01]WED65576.1 hypothetical protein PXH66_01765 [Opitutaceae bacterium LMO-M01]
MAWAREQGWVIAAPEVRVPRSGYRADVAAIGRGESARCAVFECKQARADFLKDAHDDQAARTELTALVKRRARLEKLLGEHRPDLRRGDTLFAEFDAWDFGDLPHKGYHDLLSKIATVQTRVLKGTKFAKMLRYRCADFLYLVVEDDIYAQAEIPAGWGLLVRCGDALELRRKPARLDADQAQRRALLESIALKATKALAAAAT